MFEFILGVITTVFVFWVVDVHQTEYELKTQLQEVTEQRDGLMEIYKERNDCVYKYEEGKIKI